MRVAIYAQARSGSTALYNYIKDSLSLKGIFEPYNPKFTNRFTEEEIWEKDNVVVKFLIRDNNIAKRIPLAFDKVIYLTRSNDLEGAESLARAQSKGEWNKKYFYNKSNFENKHIIKLKEYRNTHKKFIQSQGNFQIHMKKYFMKELEFRK